MQLLTSSHAFTKALWFLFSVLKTSLLCFKVASATAHACNTIKYRPLFSTDTFTYLIPSLVPRLSWNANIYRTESLVSFVCKHDIIKIGQNRKATFACCSTNYTSTLGVYVIQCPIARYV